MKAPWKFITLQISIVSILLLTACGVDEEDIQLHEKYKAQLNPTPKYFFTVEGNVDPAFQGKMYLEWRATYQTANQECKYSDMKYQGAARDPLETVAYKAQPDKLGNYHMVIPIDHFKSGNCGWYLVAIDMDYGIEDNNTQKDELTLSWFSQKPTIKNRKATLNIICGSDITACDFQVAPESDLSSDFSLKGQYLLNINIRRKHD